MGLGSRVKLFMLHRRQGFLYLIPHLLVTLLRIRATFLRRKVTPLRTAAIFLYSPSKSLPSALRQPSLLTLFRRTVTPLRTGSIFLRVLLGITPYPTHWDIPAIRRAFELFLNLTINTPRSCGSSGHPTRVFATLTRVHSLPLSLYFSHACPLSLSRFSRSLSRVFSPLVLALARALFLSLFFLTRESPTRACSLSLSLVLVAAQGPPISPAVPCLARRTQCHRSAPSTGHHSASHRRCAMSCRLSAKGGMLSGEPCPRPDAKDTSCPLRPCCALARAEPMQLRSSSGCKRYILNALLMLRTSWCRRYTLKVTCRLNVRAHSSSSLPLQSAAYASASTRSLCAPQRAHNAVSLSSVLSRANAWSGNSAGARPRNSSAFSHFLLCAEVAPPVRCSAQLARSPRATDALEVLLLHLPPPLASPRS